MNNGIRIRLGKRDRFWLVVVLLILTALFVVRWESPGGFADNGKPVWKSGMYGKPLSRDSAAGPNLHASAQHPAH